MILELFSSLSDSVIPGSLETGKRSCVMRQLFLEGKKYIWLVGWHQEIVQEFLFKDFIRSHLSCFILPPIQSWEKKKKKKSKTRHFLFLPLFQWTWELRFYLRFPWHRQSHHLHPEFIISWQHYIHRDRVKPKVLRASETCIFSSFGSTISVPPQSSKAVRQS